MGHKFLKPAPRRVLQEPHGADVVLRQVVAAATLARIPQPERRRVDEQRHSRCRVLDKVLVDTLRRADDEHLSLQRPAAFGAAVGLVRCSALSMTPSASTAAARPSYGHQATDQPATVAADKCGSEQLQVPPVCWARQRSRPSCSAIVSASLGWKNGTGCAGRVLPAEPAPPGRSAGRRTAWCAPAGGAGAD